MARGYRAMSWQSAPIGATTVGPPSWVKGRAGGGGALWVPQPPRAWTPCGIDRRAVTGALPRWVPMARSPGHGGKLFPFGGRTSAIAPVWLINEHVFTALDDTVPSPQQQRRIKIAGIGGPDHERAPGGSQRIPPNSVDPIKEKGQCGSSSPTPHRPGKTLARRTSQTTPGPYRGPWGDPCPSDS